MACIYTNAISQLGRKGFLFFFLGGVWFGFDDPKKGLSQRCDNNENKIQDNPYKHATYIIITPLTWTCGNQFDFGYPIQTFPKKRLSHYFGLQTVSS